jgi:hypothetical protein
LRFVFDISVVRGLVVATREEEMNMSLNEKNNVVCEVLENRTMMSAALMVHASVHAVAPSVHVAAKPAPKAAAKATLPAILANPALSDPGVKYTNFASQPLFSSSGPTPNDINQGDLGDCYFLSTLSAIAKVDPAVIRKDIINNNDGTYTVDFSGAKTKQVRVSADLPTWSDGELAYAGGGTGHAIWVAIFEKAFAEIRTAAKSYASISGGWMSEVFSDLGIKSQSTYATASATALGTLMAKDLKANDAATFATEDTIQDGASLIADHAYELDSITLDKNGKPLTVRLRNPWGVDGAGNDGSNDGYVTLTIQQVFDNMSGMVVAKA